MKHAAPLLGTGADAPTGRALVGGHLEHLTWQPGGDIITAAGRIIDEAAVTWLPPIEPRTILALALNYRDHAAELNLGEPELPALFPKFRNALVGHRGLIVRPRGIEFMHYETELAVVIGKRARYIKSEKEALRFVAGYCLCNDVSERVFQAERAGQWMKGKGCESFGPIGPWLVTRDEVKDTQNLKMTLTVNGETRQEGSTNTMIFSVPYIVWYCSQFFVMEPGDIITTGTPPGVALGHKPPKWETPGWLKPGDTVKLWIEGLGEQTQKVVPTRK